MTYRPFWPATALAILIAASPAPLWAQVRQAASRAADQATQPQPPRATTIHPDPGYFPIAVWLQQPRFASRYKEAGINLYVGLWNGPTTEQLDTLRAAGMRVICDQNATGLAHRDDPIIAAWMHGDEPDNAQPVRDPETGRTGYGPPVPPARIVADYQRLRAADPGRPVLLNLGQGVANDRWVGRGPEGRIEDYPEYVKGADIVSFDVYPVAGVRESEQGEDLLWYVARGVERLVGWTAGAKPVWSCIECTHIDNPRRKATPAQVRAEVWMAVIHGARGLIYFVHEFAPAFNDHALLDDPDMLAGVTAVNAEIRAAAPVLNAGEAVAGARVVSSDPDVPVAALVLRHGGAIHVFAVGLRDGQADATLTIPGLPATATAGVLDEDRTLTVRDGVLRDHFTPYAVRRYRIPLD
jgi:hypothetical protein